MKCTSCQAEEQTPEIILRKLIEVYGKELLQQEQRLSGMISDLFAQDKRTKKMLLLSVKEQVPQQIYAITNNNEREIRLSAIQLHMQEEVFLNEEIAVQIISIWRNVFDRKDPDDSYEIVWRRGFCGFRNSIGEMVTPYKYDDANPFKDNLALVVLDEKYGYIDKKGNEVIPLKFYRAVSFSEGLAAVKLNWNSKWGYINCQGKEVIFSDYDKIGSFIDGLAKVEKHYKTGFINNSGNIIIPLKYNNVSLFSEGLVGVRNDSDRCGFINKDGEEIIPCIFDTAYSFCNGLALVWKRDFLNNGKYGFIDKLGHKVIPCEYNDAKLFSDDFALVQVGTKWGFIDKQNYVVIAFQYIDAMSFNKGLAPVRSKEYKWGLINKKGELVLPYKYNSFGEYCNGLAPVEIGEFCIKGKWGFVNEEGEEVIKCKYDEIGEWLFSNGLAAVKLNEKWGYIDKKGQEIIPLIYDAVTTFSHGWAGAYLENSGWGFIDTDGNVLIPFHFPYCENEREHKGEVGIYGRPSDWSVSHIVYYSADDCYSINKKGKLEKVNIF